jgi:hypothetical protein
MLQFGLRLLELDKSRLEEKVKGLASQTDFVGGEKPLGDCLVSDLIGAQEFFEAAAKLLETALLRLATAGAAIELEQKTAPE